jgi:hypothetical protein
MPAAASFGLEVENTPSVLLQPLQMHNEDKFLAAFPSLPLLEFHAPTVVLKIAAGQREMLEW